MKSIRNLIIPVCGKSTRFPNTRPKWLLTHPNGNFMVVQAILGLELDKFDKIYLIALKEHEKTYHFLKGLNEDLKIYGLDKKVKVVFFDKPTESQPHTIYTAIKKEKIKGFVFIKDCDNFFNLREIPSKNCVAYCSLTDFDEINPNNKSYINIGENNSITNIIEKEIVSTTFCCGGYGFEDAQEFVKVFDVLHKYNKDLYISDIIFQMMVEWPEKTFLALESEGYSDWGTLESWRKYTNKFKCLFFDMDACIVKHSSSHFPPYIGESGPLVKNVARLKELIKTQNIYLCITTSREEKWRKATEKQLRDLGIKFDNLIMGLPHSSRRYIVNDYVSNTYPTAVAINLLRDGDDLENYL